MCVVLSTLPAPSSFMSAPCKVEQWPHQQPCMTPFSSSALLPSGRESVLTYGLPSSPPHGLCYQLAQELNWQQVGKYEPQLVISSQLNILPSFHSYLSWTFRS
jgi:hypothetical protein